MCSKGKSFSYRKLKSLAQDHPAVVYDSLLGSAVTNKNVVILENYPIIMRRDHKSLQGKVKIISGGGAGLEPAEAYYVGKGMLTAAVIGEMFTAPSAETILVAIRELAYEHLDGILLLVKNYLGDKLNFGLALDRAMSEDINIKMLIIGDNVTEFESERQGRKGLAGSVLVYKIAGEMAEQWKTLDEIVEECRENVLTDMYTVGVTLTMCGNPICDPMVSYLDSDEIALGMGIYGQRGAKKCQISSLRNVISTALEEICSYAQTSTELKESNFVMLINNLGAMSKLEEGVITTEAHRQLKDLGIKVIVTYAGTFMSSMSTHGFSITLLKVDSTAGTLNYLEAPTLAPAWPKSLTTFNLKNSETTVDASITVPPICKHNHLNNARYEGMSFGPPFPEKASVAAKQVTLFAAEALISCERQLNIIDSEAGDGDAGTVLRRGADALKKSLLDGQLNLTFPSKFLFDISDICCTYMGGLSGALYSVFFSAAAKVFLKSHNITPELCASAFRCAVKAVKHYGKAEMGDRTILDALWPAVDSFESAVTNGKNIIQAVYLAAATCEVKAEETKYLNIRWLPNSDKMYSDAGAHAATIWLRAISEGLRLSYPSESFDEETPTRPPGIFLGKFLTEEEVTNCLEDDISPRCFLSLLEEKLGEDEALLVALLHEAYKFCRKNYNKSARRISALLGTLYYTHIYFVSSRWRTPSEVYSYFRESILCHSLESPPMSIEVFEAGEIKDILLFFFENYIRNLPLVRISHLPHYRLRLKFEKDEVSS